MHLSEQVHAPEVLECGETPREATWVCAALCLGAQARGCKACDAYYPNVNAGEATQPFLKRTALGVIVVMGACPSLLGPAATARLSTMIPQGMLT